MFVSSVDNFNDLFQIQNFVPEYLSTQILSTPWQDLPYESAYKQSSWARRSILSENLPWIEQWHDHIYSIWKDLEHQVGRPLEDYHKDTVWWLDEPGFICNIHTDGELEGSLQMYWVGNTNLGTTFYNFKNKHKIRHQFDFVPNCGYVMMNMADSNGYRHLQWHGMLTPVPENTYRLSSYTLVRPVK